MLLKRGYNDLAITRFGYQAEPDFFMLNFTADLINNLRGG